MKYKPCTTEQYDSNALENMAKKADMASFGGSASKKTNRTVLHTRFALGTS